jgi:hypothetical protein
MAINTVDHGGGSIGPGVQAAQHPVRTVQSEFGNVHAINTTTVHRSSSKFAQKAGTLGASGKKIFDDG